MREHVRNQVEPYSTGAMSHACVGMPFRRRSMWHACPRKRGAWHPIMHKHNDHATENNNREPKREYPSDRRSIARSNAG